MEKGNSKETSRPKAIIVGAGVAGLTLANCFAKADIDYVILEHAEMANRSHGSNVFLVPNGLRILDQLGLYERLKEKGTSATANYFWEQRGDRLKVWTKLEAGTGMGYEERWGYPQLSLFRSDLLIALWEQVDDDHIYCGRKVTSIREEEDHVTAICEDGSEFTGDFIVGCDGAWSHVRRAMFRNVEIEEPKLLSEGDKQGLQCRYHAIFGFSKPMQGIEINNRFNWMNGRGYMLNTIACPAEEEEGSARVGFALFNRIENPAESLKLQWSQADANEMSEQYKNLLTPHTNVRFGQIAAEADVLVKVNLEERCFDCWTYGRTILIGDAAHKMSPFNGQGSNQGIEGAVILTNVLYQAMKAKKEVPMTREDYEAAFKVFISLRHDRVRFIVDDARRMGNLCTWPNTLWRIAGKVLFQLPYFFTVPLLDKFHEIMPTLKWLPAPPLKGSVKPKEHPLYY